MAWLLFPLAIVAGALTSVQSGCNATLERVFDRPILVALVSVSVSILAASALGLVVWLTAPGQVALPAAQRLGLIPWWAWLGGVCGVAVLVSQPIVAPRLGAGIYIGLLVTASTIASIVLDHFGLLGFTQHTAGLGRILGCALMALGIALVSIF